MTKTLISERPRLISIYEFQHHHKMVNNRSYAINLVDKAISRGQTTIQLDSSKLEHKVYTGTSCYMYNRLGEYMQIMNIKVIKETFDNDTSYTMSSTTFNTVKGYSNPKYGDKFSRYEGRINALRNAVSNIQLLKSDPNFNDLLTVKRFINTFELEVNCTTISYQFMDLWLAILSNNEESIKDAAINYVGLDAYDKWLKNCILTFNDTMIDFESVERKLNYVDKYSLFKSSIKKFKSCLF